MKEISDNCLRVLCVDEDLESLHKLESCFTNATPPWKVVIASTAEGASDCIKSNRFDVVISELHMPKLNGVEFLKLVKILQPHAIRFLLSGYSDQNLTFESVNIAHQCFSKPCLPSMLKENIGRIYFMNSTLNKSDVSSFISGLKTIPSAPAIYIDMRKELESDFPDLDALAEIIRKDPALSAKILQLVNTAFFGIPQRVEDMYQAVMLLGSEVLKSLVLVLGLASKYEDDLAPHFSTTQFSQHAIQVADCSLKIARKLPIDPREADGAFTAGLLHDLGRLILAGYNPAFYAEIVSQSDDNSLLLCDLEEREFGVTHAQVGAYLLNLWGLPTGIVEAVAFHHPVERVNLTEHDPDITTAVFLAESLIHNYKSVDEAELDRHIDEICEPFIRVEVG